MNKVVITGATGMIGKCLIDVLTRKNIDVLAIVRENSKRAKNLSEHKNLKIIECNLDNLCNLDMSNTNYDTFFHLGWEGTSGAIRNDAYIQNSNIKHTLDAVELAKKLGCTTFIGVGSQAEYGRVQGLISENTKVNPETAYGIAKYTAGQLSRVLANKYNIKHIWSRVFSAYGPYDGENTLVMSSIKQMIEEGKSPDYTKGEQLWDYIYCEDVAKALLLIAEKGKNNSTYCIAQGEAHPLYKYIETIRDKINPEIELRLGKIPYSENQVMNLSVNIDKLKSDTGFVPHYTFEKGIEETIKWYRKRAKNEEN